MTNNYVVCLKYGDKYSAEYVNKLYSMVKRNLTIPFEFVCFTENSEGIDSEIRVEPLKVQSGITGWWYKPMFFDKQFPLKGTILFFDLDVIIFENIDKLFRFQPGKFCIIRDFTRHQIKDWSKMNSSVFRLETGSLSYVYDNFMSNVKLHTKRFHGDQDFIYSQVQKDFCFWPDEWIQSYKWEMRGKPPTSRVNGVRNFVKPGEPKILPETSVAVFHGEPNPHNCIDPWCASNWC